MLCSPPRAIGIGPGRRAGREDPLISRVKKEREILHVIVAVMSKDVEAGQRVGLFGILDIPGQRQGSRAEPYRSRGWDCDGRHGSGRQGYAYGYGHRRPGRNVSCRNICSFSCGKDGFQASPSLHLGHQAIGVFDSAHVSRRLGIRKLDHPVREAELQLLSAVNDRFPVGAHLRHDLGPGARKTKPLSRSNSSNISFLRPARRLIPWRVCRAPAEHHRCFRDPVPARN